MSAAIPESWQQHDRKIRPYVWSHRAIGWTRSALGLGVLLWFILGNRYKMLEWTLAARYASWVFVQFAYFAAIVAVWEVLSFPFSVAAWRVERHFGLSKQRFGGWFLDKVKGWALGAVLGAIVLGLVLSSYRLFDDKWWLAAATLFLLVGILLAQLAPILLIPLFFKLEPMKPGPLKERLLAICARFAIEVKDIYHLGMGEKTEKGNAAVVGLGRTKRILIGDTLYEKFPAEQVEAVFAHELGHQVHNDLWKGIGLSAVFTYVSFFLAALLALLPSDHEVGTPHYFFAFFVAVSLVQMPLGILQALFSRSRERHADDFAAVRIGLSAPLADALERLTFQNWGSFRPNAVLEFLNYSHPAPWRRITRLRRYSST